MDDLTLAEKINLKKDLALNSEIVHPAQFHERTGHCLISSKCATQTKVNEIAEFAIENKMKINKNKCSVLLFNRSKKFDFRPTGQLEEELFNVSENFKLLGVVISSDLKWHEHVNFLSKKCNSRLWLLRRLTKLGAPQNILIDLYNKQIRSILEYAVPVWSPGLNNSDKVELERIEKTAFSIIFCDKNYEKTLMTHKLQSLEERRWEICRKFAEKTAINPKCMSWFAESKNPYNMRNNKLYKKIFCRIYISTAILQRFPLRN